MRPRPVAGVLPQPPGRAHGAWLQEASVETVPVLPRDGPQVVNNSADVPGCPCTLACSRSFKLDAVGVSRPVAS